MARQRPRRRSIEQGLPHAPRERLLDRAAPQDIAVTGHRPEAAPAGFRWQLRKSEPDEPRPRRIGIVFVHGIGSQLADRTLIEWASPLVRAISAWQEVNRADLVGVLSRDVQPDRPPELGLLATDPGVGVPQRQPVDPVANAAIDFTGDDVPMVQLHVPGLGSRDGSEAGRAQTWLLTEAWWSSRVEPPSFATMVDWCGRQGIVARVAKAVIAEDRREGVIGAIAKATSAIGLGLFLSTMTTLALFAFGILKTIAKLVPIDAVKDATVFASFETFLTTWWGDTYVLLRNPVEAANIRGRVAEAILALRDRGVDALIVIGHSGGTIVSYTTLSDPGLAKADAGSKGVAADLLVTHAEAINLARTLTFRVRQVARDGRLSAVGAIPTADRTNPDSIRTDRWIDFWANRDPAPNGPLSEALESPPRVESHQIWNRMSISEDHGGYWDNDEEFVLPLLRELDVVGLRNEVSRFDTYAGNCGSADDWTARHRQRVWTLAFWRRLMFVIPGAAILVALLREHGFFSQVTGAATAVAHFLKITDSLDALRGIVGPLPNTANVLAPLLVSAMAGLGIIVLGGSLHALGQIGKRGETWGEGTFWPGVAEWATSILAVLAFGYVCWNAGSGLHGEARFELTLHGPGSLVIGPITPDLYAFGAALGMAFTLATLIVFAVLSDRLSRVRSTPQRSVFAIMTTGLLLYFLAALFVCFVADLTTRTWIVGTVVAVLVFRQIGSFGTKRWVRWDENEREMARRRDPSPPGRVWPAIQGLVILIGLILIAVAIAFGDGHDGFPGTRVFLAGVAWLAASGILMTVIDGARSETAPTGAG